MKKIVVVSSSRADWGYLKPLIDEINVNENFELEIIAPSNHPNMEDVVYADRTTMMTDGTHVNFTRSIDGVQDAGYFYTDCFKLFSKINPDIVVVLGDRFEIQMAATAAFLLNIPIAHLQAGDVTTGSFDDELRSCISMMSTYLFCANTESAVNARRKTEKTAYVVGSTGVDSIFNLDIKSIEELQPLFSVDLSKPFIIAMFHPVTKELEHTKKYIINMMNALYRWGEQVIFIMPNIDPENQIIRDYVCENLFKARYKWQLCENIPHDTFLSLMAYAHMLVGNSSSGIIEAESFCLPVVDIGNRQKGRVKAENVRNCGYDEEDIFLSMVAVDSPDNVCGVICKYGDGHASKRIIEILEKELLK